MMFEPKWTSPPGATALRSISAQGLTRAEAADSLILSDDELDRFLDGLVEIDIELADKLEELTGKPRAFWIRREEQYRYDLSSLSDGALETGLDPIKWARRLPLAQMVKLSWIQKKPSRLETAREALKFFGVTSVAAWKERYSSELSVAAFRASNSFEANDAATAAWLRRAERLASQQSCLPWNKDKFLQLLPELRRLSIRKNPRAFFPELVKRCSEVGVCVVFVPNLTGCRAYGATRFLTPFKAMIVLSNRYKTDDHFWFTFFHEAGHLILHSNDALFIESGNSVETHEEEEANSFAEKILVPEKYLDDLVGGRITGKAVTRLAVRIGISRGILVGQLQHKGFILHRSLNYLKKSFRNEDFYSNL